MNMLSQTSIRTTLLAGLLASSAFAQVISAPYDTDYSFVDLGTITGVPTNFGGINFLAGDPDTLLIGGQANTSAADIYAVPVTRDALGHITSFGAPAVFAACPFIDGGLSYGPGNVLFATGYSNNTLLQFLPGSTAPDSTTNLATFGVPGSVGTCAFVPAGFPGAGQLKIASYSGGSWHSLDIAVNAAGTYDVLSASPSLALTGGPEGILYPPPGSPQLPDFGTVLVSEYGGNSIAIYDIDANGDPIISTRRTLMTGLSGAEGAVVDPVTGDMLFSTFGSGNRVIRISGFAACGFFQNYGQGCGGAAPAPQISGSGCPQPGESITVDVSGAPSLRMGVLCLGETQLNAPVLGCTVLVLPDASINIVSDAAGDFSYTVGIPNMPSFNQWNGYWQAAFFEASGPLGVVLTDGLDMFVQ